MFLILIFLFVCMLLLMVDNNVTLTFIHLHHLSLSIFLQSKSSNRVNCHVWILTDIEWQDSWWHQVWLHPHVTACFSMNELRSLKNQTAHPNTMLIIDSLILRCFNNKNNVSLGWNGENVRFGVLTVVLTKMHVFWDKALLISSYQHTNSIPLHCDALLLGEWWYFKEF
jgi:hypothetical protein